MIIPSIDLMGGQTVQLVGGRDLALEAGCPLPIAERFGVIGELALIDLDAALGTGDNRALVERVCRVARCRVGGGIRSVARAVEALDAGAEKLILGTAATPELLRQLPKSRLIAALDALDGEVVVEGWRTKTGASVPERMRELRDVVGGFLVTFVEREGRLGGTDLERARELRDAAGDASLTIAGGVTTVAEVAALDKLGIDAQVGMALYQGHMELGDAFAAPLVSDRADGLFATVVVDEHGRALGQCWSSRESLRAAIATRTGIYHSRQRGLWHKGASSGATQRLVRVDLDCDRDALRFTVVQAGPGFCHTGTTSCWGALGGMPALAEVLRGRATDAPAGSYTARLLHEPELLRKKLIEEAGELGLAASHDEVAHEAADVLYFTLVRMAKAGVSLTEVEQILEARARKITRRPGDAK
ncbi:MAG: phosphoribosyl-ATP diphosphatase [Myxococcales bacterium]|nr:phosphoribosyl-ATP diphosphatase [Myxococcales bacterium]